MDGRGWKARGRANQPIESNPQRLLFIQELERVAPRIYKGWPPSGAGPNQAARRPSGVPAQRHHNVPATAEEESWWATAPRISASGLSPVRPAGPAGAGSNRRLAAAGPWCGLGNLMSAARRTGGLGAKMQVSSMAEIGSSARWAVSLADRGKAGCCWDIPISWLIQKSVIFVLDGWRDGTGPSRSAAKPCARAASLSKASSPIRCDVARGAMQWQPDG